MAAVKSDTSMVDVLSTEVTIESNGTILEANFTLNDAGQKTDLWVVDTGVWYHYYKGIWYPQNVSPFA